MREIPSDSKFILESLFLLNVYALGVPRTLRKNMHCYM